MLDYILKVLLFQTMFLAVYDLFLKRETFFQWNRAYLLLTSILAYVLPFIQIKRVQNFVPDSYQVYLEDVPEMILSPSTILREQINLSEYFLIGAKTLFVLGAVVAGVLFIFRLSKIFKLIRLNRIEKKSKFYLVWLKETEAYSFFNYIFLGRRMDADTRKQVIAHEMVHVRQKHSIDLLFFEGQKVLAWFNPFSYWYQNRISELHEFIADAKAVKQQNKATYFNHLLVQSFGVADVSFINPFLKTSLIKKRILMLNKHKSNKLRKLKYLLLIPMLGGILLYTSCEKADSAIPEDKSVKEIISELNAKVEAGEMTKDDKRELLELLFKASIDNPKLIDEVVVGKPSSSSKSDSDNVMFAVIEEAPVFPTCEDSGNPKKCLQDEIKKHVNKKYNTSLAGDLGLDPGRKRVHVQFLIDKNGDVTDIRARGPHVVLEEEAIRVIKMLPKMKPGKQRGKEVGVRYTLPITLQISGDDDQKTGEISPKLKSGGSYTIPAFLNEENEYFEGVVVANENKSLPGVDISVKNSDRKTVSDFDGKFKIKMTKGEILVFNFNDLPTIEYKLVHGNGVKVVM